MIFPTYINYMHNYIIKVTLGIILMVFHSPSNFSQDSNSIGMGSLTVKLSGFANDKGECWFALDNSEEVYESEDTVFVGKVIPISNKEVSITIDSLKFGTYAIKVFHDENSNGELDTNLLSIPTEDYGFSNNASGWFGPPRWEKAKFLFNENKMTVKISVD